MKKTREMAIKQKHQLQVVTLIRTSQNEIFNCECGNNLFKKKEFSTLYKWRKDGVLGETQRLRVDSYQVPLYVAGFWFDTLTRASHSLGQAEPTIVKRLRDGNVEQKSQKTYKNRGRQPHDR